MDKNLSDKSGSYRRSNKKLTLILVLGVFGMFGFGYLMVPIFTWVCKQTGINGKSVLSKAAVRADMQVDAARTVKIELMSTVHNNMNFIFKPEQHYIQVHPGERKTIYFYAENATGKAITIQAVPSITPADGARFFKKIECFCFTQQAFAQGEKAKMFVNFYVDPEMPVGVKEMTLAYTLFDATGYESKEPVVTKGRIRL